LILQVRIRILIGILLVVQRVILLIQMIILVKKVSKKGGFTEWREVLCSGDVTVSVIRQVQDALRSKGYDPGPTDNVMGSRTKAALVKFQKDNGLPVGQLDFQTLKALGVNY